MRGNRTENKFNDLKKHNLAHIYLNTSYNMFLQKLLFQKCLRYFNS